MSVFLFLFTVLFDRPMRPCYVPTRVPFLKKLPKHRHHANVGCNNHSENRIPVAPLSLDHTLDIARHPAAVIVAGLRVGALTVGIALPRSDIEGEVALDGLVSLGRLVVRPYPVANSVLSINRGHH